MMASRLRAMLIALAVYAAAVAAYVAYTYWTSDEYRAATHYLAAKRLLGSDGGRHTPQPQLLEAYRELVFAAQRLPQAKFLHEELESLNWRFEEKHWRLPPELRLAADAQGAAWQQLQQQDAPRFAVGLRERGWDPESLAAGPGRTLAWAGVGAVGIVAALAAAEYARRRSQSQGHEAHVQTLERELVDLERQRTRSRAKRP